MKKEMVIVAGTCYPIKSATGAIALKCAGFCREDYNVRLICIQEGDNEAKGLSVEGAELYTLSQWRLRNFQKFSEKTMAASGFSRAWYRGLRDFMRLLGRIESAFFTMDNMAWYTEKAFRQLELLNREKPIDVILSVNMPIEAHLAAEKFKRCHSGVRWVSYWGDALGVLINRRNLFISLEKLRETERRLMECSDGVLVTEEVYEHLGCTWPAGLEKAVKVPYYMPDRILYGDGAADEAGAADPVKLVYMGSLYRKIRNPEYLLKVVKALSGKCTLDLYIAGDCMEIAEDYAAENPELIRVHGTVGSEELYRILKSADVLVNIENMGVISKPSKLFELLAYRKPVLDFSCRDLDNEIMEKYEAGYVVYMDDRLEKSVDVVAAALEEVGRKPVLQKIEESFPENTESHVKEIIRAAVSGRAGN